MQIQVNTPAEINLHQDIVRDLLDSEILLIGGGDVVVNGY